MKTDDIFEFEDTSSFSLAKKKSQEAAQML